MLRILTLSFLSCVLANVIPEVVPALLWTSHGHRTGQHELTQVLNANQPQILREYIPIAPQLSITFLLNKMNTGTLLRAMGSFDVPRNAHLHDVVSNWQQAGTSVFVPYLSNPTVLPQYFSSPVENMPFGDCQDLSEQISRKPLTSNLVVHLPSHQSFEDMNHCVNRVVSEVRTRTSGNFVAVLSAAHSDPVTLSFSDASHDEDRQSSHILAAMTELSAEPVFETEAVGVTPVVIYAGPLYITSNILFALIVAGFLISILLVGVCCLANVEAPRRYTTSSLVIGKEF